MSADRGDIAVERSLSKRIHNASNVSWVYKQNQILLA